MDSERLSPKALPRVKKRETPISTKQLVDLLSKVTCFAKFSPEQMIQVLQSLFLYYSLVDPCHLTLFLPWGHKITQAAKKMTEEEFHPNTPVIRQGEIGKEFYIIEQG